jgi:hypothetical protein
LDGDGIDLCTSIMSPDGTGVWKELVDRGDDKALQNMVRDYSINLGPAPGLALTASAPPVTTADYDPAYLAHMVNSTKNGTPAQNATLVPHLFGGTVWAVVASRNIAAGDEVIVDYGSDWFETHGQSSHL